MSKNDYNIDITPLERGDSVTVQAIFDGMSPEARFFRFLQAMPRLSRSMLAALTEVDGVRHRAYVAHDAHGPAGIVRLVMDTHGDTELSVSVVDRARGRGVGKRLVQFALDEAARMGHEHVEILVHPQNTVSRSLFRTMSATFRLDDGLLVGRVPTGAAALAA